MKEIEKLSNKSYSKLESSKILYKTEKYSDSASLSYYSMFLMAKALLKKKGITTKTHEGAIYQFSLNYVHENTFSKKIFSNFASAQSKREDADYRAEDGITQEIAEELIAQAEEFLNEAEKFL